MHKITKGLKKKKKTKKHKKEDELFDEAELEKYRREHQQETSAEGQQQETLTEQEGADNEEWKRFKALTAGVDSVLKKTEEDLTRIKSTSYFQRKPPGSSTSESASAQPKEAKASAPSTASPAGKKKSKTWVGFEEGSLGIDVPAPEDHIGETEDEESGAAVSVDELLGSEPTAEEQQPEEEEEEETEDELAIDDDIFDTSYIDVVKLAYIPDSPTQEEEEFDPFDTSIAEKVIKEEEEQKKNKKTVVSLGCAVEVLTGRLESTPSLAGKRRRPTPRHVQEQDLLLDDNSNVDAELESEPVSKEEPVQNLLDGDTELTLLDENPISCETAVVDLQIVATDNLLIAPTTVGKDEIESESKNIDVKNIIAEFDLISETTESTQANTTLDVAQPKTNLDEDEDLEDEFAALAAESVSKKATEPVSETLQANEDDPFDTTVAVAVLGEPIPHPDTLEIETDFNSIPIETRGPPFPISPDVDIVLATESNQQEWTVFEEKSSSLLETHSPELLQQSPLEVQEVSENILIAANDNNETVQVDPFDTSFAENILPGKAELKIIETEILGNCEPVTLKAIQTVVPSITCELEDDFDFDPRKDEIKPETKPPTEENNADDDTEPRLLSAIQRDLLGGSTTQLNQDPLTPLEKEEEQVEVIDPFDTSVVAEIVVPGKAELKFIEKELLGEIEGTLKRSISDQDFNPRAAQSEAEAAPEPEPEPETKHSNQDTEVPDLLNVKAGIPKIVAFDVPTPSSRPDLLVVGAEEEARISKPLTPYYVDSKANEFCDAENETQELDPFDTSFAANLAPGKAELKLIESELVGETSGIKHSLSDQDFNPRSEENETGANSLEKSVPPQGRRFSDFTGDRRRVPPCTLNIKGVVVTPVPLEVILSPTSKPDLLVVEENAPVTTKPLTPAIEEKLHYTDPFDTSIASNLLPGRAELKVLEKELVQETGLCVINSDATSLKRSYTDPDFNPRDDEEEAKAVTQSPLEKPDLLNLPSEVIPDTKTLTPQPHNFENGNNVYNDDIDPFDTSIAGALVPGKAELKILESEFIDQ